MHHVETKKSYSMSYVEQSYLSLKRHSFRTPPARGHRTDRWTFDNERIARARSKAHKKIFAPTKLRDLLVRPVKSSAAKHT